MHHTTHYTRAGLSIQHELIHSLGRRIREKVVLKSSRLVSLLFR